MADDGLKLTPEEISNGWHFCWDWDGLLIGPGMGEMKSCKCARNRAEFEQGLNKMDHEMKSITDALDASERLSEDDFAIRFNAS